MHRLRSLYYFDFNFGFDFNRSDAKILRKDHNTRLQITLKMDLKYHVIRLTALQPAMHVKTMPISRQKPDTKTIVIITISKGLN